jgi:rhodanese-related sulfurtransferase
MDRLIEYAGHHPLLFAAALLAAALVATYELWMQRQNAQGVSPQELIRLMNQGALVLDLRAQEQFGGGHISGARQMASDQILKAGETLKKHREKLVVVYCDAGSMSASAVRQLAAQGFTKVFSLRGGLNAWRAENLPLARG